MAKKSKESTRNSDLDSLKGWQQIALFWGNQSQSRNAGQTQECQWKNTGATSLPRVKN